MFELNPRLEADTDWVLDLQLSRVLLMNDSRYPWLILVPRIPNVREWLDLSSTDQALLLAEQLQVSQCLQTLLSPDKLNVATLGNIVPQLHLHIIARFETDFAWPSPVWGRGDSVRYPPDEKVALLARYRSALAATSGV
jgi:diadenosine tetraphosphate (Ap4A) HIT family hydrolase